MHQSRRTLTSKLKSQIPGVYSITHPEEAPVFLALTWIEMSLEDFQRISGLRSFDFILLYQVQAGISSILQMDGVIF